MIQRPLKKSQIEAALKLHSLASGWQNKDHILRDLKGIDPQIVDEDATWLKLTAINKFYRAGVWGKHIDQLVRGILQAVLQRSSRKLDSFDFVQLATRDVEKDYSVAVSKFAHFFISENDFPILDSYAEKAARFHVGRKQPSRVKKTRYQIFCENIDKLKVGEIESLDNKTLDHYLWLAGQYKAWEFEGKIEEIDAEVKGIFENEASRKLLKEMFPYEEGEING